MDFRHEVRWPIIKESEWYTRGESKEYGKTKENTNMYFRKKEGERENTKQEHKEKRH